MHPAVLLDLIAVRGFAACLRVGPQLGWAVVQAWQPGV